MAIICSAQHSALAGRCKTPSAWALIWLEDLVFLVLLVWSSVGVVFF